MNIQFNRTFEESPNPGFAELQHLVMQVSHDLRSPLACLGTIIANSEALESDHKEIARKCVERVREIANDILAKYGENSTGDIRRRRGSDRYSPAPSCYIVEAIEDILQEKRVLLDATKTKVTASFESISADTQVRIRKDLLKRILSNLLNNAMEAIKTQEGEIHLRVRSDQAGSVQLDIQDSGIGLPAEVLQHLGTRGFSYGKADSADSGYGLGLSHAREHLAACGGSWEIRSELGKGTVVSLTIPETSQTR